MTGRPGQSSFPRDDATQKNLSPDLETYMNLNKVADLSARLSRVLVCHRLQLRQRIPEPLQVCVIEVDVCGASFVVDLGDHPNRAKIRVRAGNLVTVLETRTF